MIAAVLVVAGLVFGLSALIFASSAGSFYEEGKDDELKRAGAISLFLFVMSAFLMIAGGSQL